MTKFKLILLTAFALVTVSNAQGFGLFFAAPPSSPPRLQIVVDKAPRGESENAQTLSVFIDSQLEHKFYVSTGMEAPTISTSGSATDRVTPVGAFRIYARHINYVSKTWINAKMPFALFFHDGAAIHSSDEYQFIGERDSGGCIRLHPKNAKIVWDLVDMYGVGETIVIVFDGSVAPFPTLPARF